MDARRLLLSAVALVAACGSEAPRPRSPDAVATPPADGPDAEAAYEDARRLLDRADYPGARAAAERAVELDPEHADAWALLGQACEVLGEHACARDAAERVLSLDAERTGQWERLGRAQLALGDARAAVASLRTALDHGRFVMVRVQLMRALLAWIAELSATGDACRLAEAWEEIDRHVEVLQAEGEMDDPDVPAILEERARLRSTRPADPHAGPRVPRVVADRLRVRAGPLAPDAIARVAAEHVEDVEACYTAELARDSEAEGWLVARVGIARDGSVTSARIIASSFIDDAFGQCVAAAVTRWRYPGAAAPTTAEQSFAVRTECE